MAGFNANQRFRVLQDDALDMAGVQALTTVYLPIIGRNAYTLYMAWMFQPQTAEPSIAHVDFFDQLAFSTQNFQDAREQLEGMGLVQTFEQETSFGSQWVYRLFPPMPVRKFLADNMLASLLAHYLGRDAFDELVARVAPENHDIPGKNVSKSFFDVIGPDTFERLSEAPITANEVTPLQAAAHDTQNNLDLTLLEQMLAHNGVKSSDIRRHQEELALQKHLYGLTDLDLVRAIQGTLTAQATIDVTALQRQLAAGFQMAQRQPAPVSEAPKQSAEVASDDHEHPLIKLATTLSPLQFLARMRAQTGGFVTDAEQRLLTNVVELHRLPDEALNIILYELTAVEKKTSLSKSLVDTIVNDWAQHSIKSAKDGLRYLAQRAQAKPATTGSTAPRRNNWSRPQQAKETRPDWENQKAQTASDDLMREAAEAMARINEQVKQNKED